MGRIAYTRAALLVLVLVMAGCREAPGPESLARAARLVDARDFASAKPLLKAYLLAHPRDASAHYLYGKCFLHGEDPWLQLALGEFLTAEHLLAAGAARAPLPGFDSDAAFAATLNMDTALVFMRAIYEGLAQPVPPPTLREMVRQALQHVDRGLELEPDNPVLQDMRATLAPILAQ